MTSLRQRMLEDMQVRQLSPCTQQTYVETVARFARHFDRSPARLGPAAIRAYQVYLTNERRLAPSSVVVAVSALRFLYRVTLRKHWVFDDVIPVPKKPRSLPVVLSRFLSPGGGEESPRDHRHGRAGRTPDRALLSVMLYSFRAGERGPGDAAAGLLRAGYPGVAQTPREGREAARRAGPPPGRGGPRRLGSLGRGGRARGAAGGALPECGSELLISAR